MVEKFDSEATVDLRQVVLTYVIQAEALVNILESKGILTRKELTEEVKSVAGKLPSDVV